MVCAKPSNDEWKWGFPLSQQFNSFNTLTELQQDDATGTHKMSQLKSPFLREAISSGILAVQIQPIYFMGGSETNVMYVMYVIEDDQLVKRDCHRKCHGFMSTCTGKYPLKIRRMPGTRQITFR